MVSLFVIILILDDGVFRNNKGYQGVFENVIGESELNSLEGQFDEQQRRWVKREKENACRKSITIINEIIIKYNLLKDLTFQVMSRFFNKQDGVCNLLSS